MKITLKNLHEATAQQVFDQVARHMLAQGKRSLGINPETGSDRCAYRGENGMMCAAGCLIGDDEYNAAMEGRAWTSLSGDSVVPRTTHDDLIDDLQYAHDITSPSEWRGSLRYVARRHGLSAEVVA